MTAYIVGTLIVAGLALLIGRFAWAYFRLRGTRVVTCPETHQQAAVEIDPIKAASGAVMSHARFRLEACSHWPQKAGCGQACLSQIEAAPIDCLVRTVLTNWYQGKACAICHRAAGEIDWYDRRPALLSPDGQLLLWEEVRAEHLDDILGSHKPICFDCYVAETFRKNHPELVLDNPYAAPPPGRS